MSQVMRYTPSLKPGLMIEDAEGKWAKYEVLAQVVAEREAAQETLNRWHALNLEREAREDTLRAQLAEAEDAHKALEDMVALTAKAVGDGTGLMWQKIQFAFLRDIPALRTQLADRDSELAEFATEITLAISDSQIRSAMTVIGRSRFLQLLQTYNARIDAALSTNAKPEACDHEWVDARNQYVKSGELCVRCGAIRSGNQTTDGAKPVADHE